MKFKKTLIILLLSIFILPTLAFALNFEVGEEILLSEIINDDYYAAGGAVQVESDVNGDLIVGGGRIFVDSVISQDLMLVGGDIIVRGEIKDDARLAGGNITIDALIKDDLLVAGGNIELGDNGFIGSDFIVAGGNITINGKVNGNMQGSGGNFYINNVIKGNLTLYSADKVTFGPIGKVMGDLSYRSPEPSKTINEENVDGSIEYKPTKLPISNKEFKAVAKGFVAGFSIFRFLTILFVGLFFIWILRFFMTNSVQTGYKNPLKSFGIGFLVLAVTPIAMLIALVTGIGISFAFILMLIWLLILCVGKLIAILMIGMKIIRVKDRSSFLRVYGAFALGALIYVLLGLVPIVGWILRFILVMIGIGALCSYEMKLFHPLHKEKKV